MLGYVSDSVRPAWGLISWNVRNDASPASGRRRLPLHPHPEISGKGPARAV